MTVNMHSEKGKQILAQAMSGGHTVLEFKEQPDGTYTIADITDHVERLEEMVDDPRQDNPTHG